MKLRTPYSAPETFCTTMVGDLLPLRGPFKRFRGIIVSVSLHTIHARCRPITISILSHRRHLRLENVESDRLGYWCVEYVRSEITEGHVLKVKLEAPGKSWEKTRYLNLKWRNFITVTK